MESGGKKEARPTENAMERVGEEWRETAKNRWN